MAKTKEQAVNAESIKKFNLQDIAKGALVGSIRNLPVEFYHDGEKVSVDIRVKQLPYKVTEPLFTRLNKGEDVVAEWLSLTLVNDEGDIYLTKEQVDEYFTQSLAGAIFNVVTGLEAVAKDKQGKLN
ncbi:hypothetical protein F909_04101 [Acinetobacter sp. ANC 3929]|uniref:phage tail assembly chaperone family protein, TAC n=1 Tax=Acinetobacter sp. ANC 3929 TaxID=1217707 RepID=UPI0002CF9F94|nr:phage tail assembly chaperone family protein, TAC [Acinetobacter sp. ANC 3929]ENW78411.1 hypothetical protein F909_04101 [Acinetobacter sp. ANC 3929]